jgi:hypothetical protein
LTTVLQIPPLEPPDTAAATYLAAAFHALVREEHAGRRPKRLLEPNHATWQRFRGRMGPLDFVELILEDGAITQPEPFDARAVLGRADALRHLPLALVGDSLGELPQLPPVRPTASTSTSKRSASG